MRKKLTEPIHTDSYVQVEIENPLVAVVAQALHPAFL